jgi:hypothetical protein
MRKNLAEFRIVLDLPIRDVMLNSPTAKPNADSQPLIPSLMECAPRTAFAFLDAPSRNNARGTAFGGSIPIVSPGRELIRAIWPLFVPIRHFPLGGNAAAERRQPATITSPKHPEG